MQLIELLFFSFINLEVDFSTTEIDYCCMIIQKIDILVLLPVAEPVSQETILTNHHLIRGVLSI
jgi:hypothetical protein